MSYVPGVPNKNMPFDGTTTPDPLQFPHVAGQFGTRIVGERREIISSRAPLGAFESLYISGRAQFDGPIAGRFQIQDTLVLPRGTTSAPSIAYIGDLDTGIYSPGPGEVGFTANGITTVVSQPGAVQFSAPITTSAGDLVLNPAGGAVDFSGKAIINFSGFFSNPNYYDVVASAAVNTIGAVTADILTIGTVTNAAYNITAYVPCLTLDGVSRGAFTVVLSAKNVGGTVSVSTVQSNVARDTPIVTATVTFPVVGTDIIMRANGIVGQSIRWFGAAKITRVTL